MLANKLNGGINRMVQYNRGLMEKVQCISYYDPQGFFKKKTQKNQKTQTEHHQFSDVLWPLLNMQKPAVSYNNFILFFNNKPRKTLLSQLTIVMRMAFLPPIPAFTFFPADKC